jgi:hypothetical protein
MNPTQQPPLTLRDIHLPDPVSWWPLAPGWWLALALVIIVSAVTILSIRRYRQRGYRRLGLQQLATIEADMATQDDHRQLIQQLSQLLRHMAILHYQQPCAGLEGQAWLDFLDQPFSNKTAPENQPFAVGPGQCFGSGPYQKNIDKIDTAALFSLCRRWIKKLPLPPKQRRSA